MLSVFVKKLTPLYSYGVLTQNARRAYYAITLHKEDLSMPTIYLSPSTQEYNIYRSGDGSEEYYMNLIADAMIPYLDSTGIGYTRNSPSDSVSSIISQSNSGNYDLHLALHSNASPENLAGVLQGADFYYYTRSRNGKRAATVLADNYQSIYPTPSLVKIMPTTALAEVTRTRAPSVLAELAYHDNEQDEAWIKANIDAIAKNLVQGLAEYFGIPFVEAQTPIDNKEGTVRTEGGRLNIRERPSMSAKVIGQAPNGATLLVFCQTGEWYCVEYDGIIGFASSDYIELG